jgi:site-specific DNA recombinase
MRQNALSGYRNGGKPPYGYRLKHEPHTNPARAAAGETKSRLVIDPAEAPIVLEILMLWATKELGVSAIADLLNKRGVPRPTATNSRLNATRRWAPAMINAMLRNPVYVGKQVWDRRDNAKRREQGSSAPWRNEDEWTVCEDAHEPIISDELFGAAQERLQRKRKSSGRPRGNQREHLLSGMVRCSTRPATPRHSGRPRDCKRRSLRPIEPSPRRCGLWSKGSSPMWSEPGSMN